MIRRRKSMRFLGGYYAFPGGKVDPADAKAEAFARCRGLARRGGGAARPGGRRHPSARLLGLRRARAPGGGGRAGGHAEDDGRPIDIREPERGRARRAHAARAARRRGALRVAPRGGGLVPRPRALPVPLALHHAAVEPDPLHRALLPGAAAAGPGRGCTATRRPPRASGSIPAEGYRRFRRGEMPMADPAECGLGYLSGFESLDALWAAHADGRHKLHGILDRIARPAGAAARAGEGARRDGGQCRRRLRRSADRRGPGRRDGARHAGPARHLCRAERARRSRRPRAARPRRRARAAGRAAPAATASASRRRSSPRSRSAPSRCRSTHGSRPGTSRAILARLPAQGAGRRRRFSPAAAAALEGLPSARAQTSTSWWRGASDAAGPGARRARRDGLLALHVRDHRLAEGGRARATGRCSLAATIGGDVLGVASADRIFATSKLFFAYALGNALADPASRACQRLSPPGLARSGLGGAVMQELSAHALFLGADLLRLAAASRAAAGHLRLGARLRLGRRAAARRDLRGVAAALRRRDPRRHGRDRDRVHGALEPAGREPRRARQARPCRAPRRQLRDAGGQPVADGEQGVLWVKTPSAAMGYYKRLDHSRRTFVGEWLRTGDVYRRDRRRLLRPLRPRGRLLQGRRASG